MRRIADYRAHDKYDPEYYARRTVMKAQAELQITDADLEETRATRAGAVRQAMLSRWAMASEEKIYFRPADNLGFQRFFPCDRCSSSNANSGRGQVPARDHLAVETLLREKIIPSLVLGKRRVVDRLELDRYVERRNAMAKTEMSVGNE